MDNRELLQQALEALHYCFGATDREESERRRIIAALRARLAQPEPDPDDEAPQKHLSAPQYAAFWERLPGYLIETCEGEVLTEELVQQAATDLYEKFPHMVASGLKPFGLLLLEERAVSASLVRALRKETEGATFMGEPAAPPARQWVDLTDHEIALINADYPHPQGFARGVSAALKDKNT